MYRACFEQCAPRTQFSMASIHKLCHARQSKVSNLILNYMHIYINVRTKSNVHQLQCAFRKELACAPKNKKCAKDNVVLFQWYEVPCSFNVGAGSSDLCNTYAGAECSVFTTYRRFSVANHVAAQKTPFGKIFSKLIFDWQGENIQYFISFVHPAPE